MAKSNDKRKAWDRTPPVQPVVVNVLPPRQSFLIICEGAKTEKNYFNSFRATKSVEDFAIRGLGANTLSLVERALEIRPDLEEKRGEPFDQAWCVFDRDSFPAQNFNAAIQLALKAGFRIAYCNEAFELWYLLHFDFHNAAIARALYKNKLSDRFGYSYQKNSDLTYSTLQRLGQEKRAMRFADNLLRERLEQDRGINPESDNPSTTVHCLVRELRNQGTTTAQENAIYQQVHQALNRDALPSAKDADETKPTNS